MEFWPPISIKQSFSSIIIVGEDTSYLSLCDISRDITKKLFSPNCKIYNISYNHLTKKICNTWNQIEENTQHIYYSVCKDKLFHHIIQVDFDQILFPIDIILQKILYLNYVTLIVTCKSTRFCKNILKSFDEVDVIVVHPPITGLYDYNFIKKSMGYSEKYIRGKLEKVKQLHGDCLVLCRDKEYVYKFPKYNQKKLFKWKKSIRLVLLSCPLKKVLDNNIIKIVINYSY
jgi:hypothetical protein